MKNSFIKVQLTSLKTIQVMAFTNMPRPNDLTFTLFDSPKDEGKKMRIIKQSGSNLINIFELEVPETYEFGKQYYVGVTSFNVQPVDVNNAIYFPEFDELFKLPHDANNAADNSNTIFFINYLLFLYSPFLANPL